MLSAYAKMFIAKQLLNDKVKVVKMGAMLCSTRLPVIEAQPHPELYIYSGPRRSSKSGNLINDGGETGMSCRTLQRIV